MESEHQQTYHLIASEGHSNFEGKDCWSVEHTEIKKDPLIEYYIGAIY